MTPTYQIRELNVTMTDGTRFNVSNVSKSSFSVSPIAPDECPANVTLDVVGFTSRDLPINQPMSRAFWTGCDARRIENDIVAAMLSEMTRLAANLMEPDWDHAMIAGKINGLQDAISMVKAGFEIHTASVDPS